MLSKVSLKNFRSIRAADLPLAPLTVFYGPTASGKSTVMYGMLALKSFASNPNRPVDAFFNFGFIDLGGFDATVFNHDSTGIIGLGVETDGGADKVAYGVEIKKATAKILTGFCDISLYLDV